MGWVVYLFGLASPHAKVPPRHSFVGAPPGLSPAHDECDWYKEIQTRAFFPMRLCFLKGLCSIFIFFLNSALVLWNVLSICVLFSSVAVLWALKATVSWVFCWSFIPVHLTKTIKYWENSMHYSLMFTYFVLYLKTRSLQTEVSPLAFTYSSKHVLYRTHLIRCTHAIRID